jgi:hypothetical protein
VPITEDVMDAVVHLMLHFFDEHPDDPDVDEETLAAYAVERGVCAHCIKGLIHETGGSDFADALGRVWDSEVWQALRERTLDAQEDDCP